MPPVASTSTVTIRLPDGSTRQFDGCVSAREVAAAIGPRLAKDALAARVDDRVVGVDYVIPAGTTADVRLFTRRDQESLDVMRHSCAHIMARAVMRLFPGVQLAFGPTIEGGFYYDVALPQPLTEQDFPAIEEEMRRLIEKDEEFERVESSHGDAVAVCQDLGQEFKVEHLQTGLADQELVSFYRQGEFVDLCRGPHLPSPKPIGAFKLLSIAGAYWKGDATREQLQRLYATAFFTREELDAHLARIDEAKRRDHRVLGKRLKLFHTDDSVGAGLILWTPRGAVVRQQLQDFISEHLRRQGYQQVFTPHIGKLDLYRTSGHFPYYQDSQYPPLIDAEQLQQLASEGCTCGELANRMKAGEIEGYLLRPMNCPHHIKIFASQPHSYRDLPVRLAEFGTVYRWEQSGEIGGLTRVRGFTQDDAHLFVTEEQIEGEMRGCLELVRIVLGTMGIEDYRVRVGLRDPASDKYVGEPANWDKAEQACRVAAESLGKPFTTEVGEAAFYGPKIDFVIRDCIGREWQLGTVQVDYNLPIRFQLEYVGPDNRPHRPVMIHRAPFGSLERFIGVLIEHFAGAFPMWLAPEQVRVLTVSEKSEEYARGVEVQLREAGIRVTGDYRSEKLGSKIRDAQLDLVPYMLVVGPRDAEQGTVSLRDRTAGDQGAMPIATVLARFREEISLRKRISQADTPSQPQPKLT
ncbi:MAG TPA: threonine--tRNA ligase [Pirellulaceae bacterium]